MRYYPGQDVAHWWQGDLSSRRLLLMIEHLPEDSATWKARRGDRWSESTHILAYMADHVVFMRAEAQGEGGMRPKPLPRPTDELEPEGQARSMHDYLMRNQEKPEERNSGGRP